MLAPAWITFMVAACVIAFGSYRLYIGFTTDNDTWKVKRITHTPAVEVAPCNVRGKVAAGAASIAGTAQVVSGDAYRSVEAAVKAKYGIQYRTMDLFSRISRRVKREDDAGVGIVISLDD